MYLSIFVQQHLFPSNFQAYVDAVEEIVHLSKTYHPNDKYMDDSHLQTIQCGRLESNGLFRESECQFRQPPISFSFPEIYTFAELTQNMLNRNKIKNTITMFYEAKRKAMVKYDFPNYPSSFIPNSAMIVQVFLHEQLFQISFSFSNVHMDDTFEGESVDHRMMYYKLQIERV